MRSIFLTIRGVASLTGLALLPAAGPAFAQGASGSVTEIAFDLRGVYEDNAARSSALLAQQRGLEVEDYIVSPSVSLTLARMVGTAEVQLSGRLGYVFHANNSDLDSERIEVAANADIPVGPCRITPEVGFQRRQSDLRDIVIVPDPLAPQVANIENVQRYGVTLGCGRTPGLAPFAGITYEKADNSSAQRERADYSATTYRGGLRYSSPAVGELSLYGSRRITELSPIAYAAGGDTDYAFDEVGLEAKRDIGSRVQATASVGYGRLDSDNLFVQSFKGVVWALDLTALIGPNLRVLAGTGREVGNSLSSDSGFVVSTPHRVRLEYAFSERVQFDLGGSITKRRYGYDVVPSPQTITNENLRLIDGGIRMDVGRRLKLRLFAGHERRNANGTFYDYKANFAGVSLGLSF